MLLHYSKSKSWLLMGSLLVVLFSFFYNYPCGYYAFHFMDTSAFFDGGYRVYAGQLPLRDFFSPTGPFLYWMTGLTFKLLGPNIFAYVTLASLLNAAGTALVLSIGWRLSRDLWLTLAAGLVNAICTVSFASASATYTSTAFFWLFVVLWLLLGITGRPGNLWRLALAGAAAAVAFYHKQTIGAAGIIFFAAFLLQSESLGEALIFTGFAVASWALLTACWIFMGGWENTVRYMYLLPMSYPHDPLWTPRFFCLAPLIVLAGLVVLRRDEWPMWIPTGLLMSWAVLLPQRMAIYFFAPLAGLLFMEDRRDRSLLFALTNIQYCAALITQGDNNQYWSCIAVLLLLIWKALGGWFQDPGHRNSIERFLGTGIRLEPKALIALSFAFTLFLGIRFSLRHVFMDRWLIFPVVGPAVGILGALAGFVFLRSIRFRPLANGIAALSCLLISGMGFHQGWRTFLIKRQQAQALEVGTDWHNRPVRIDSLRGLILKEKEASSLESAAEYLKGLPANRRPFFFFPHYYLMHPAMGQLSPQPFLWETHPIGYRADGVDEGRLCGALERTGVRTILVDESQVGASVLNQVPCLQSWVKSRFYLERKVGFFHVYASRESLIGGQL